MRTEGIMGNIRQTNDDWNDHFANETVGEQVALTEQEEPLHLFYKYLCKDRLILDLGCGLGKHLLFWHTNGYKITGIDIEPKCIQKIIEYDPSVDAKVGNILELPYDDESVEYAISYGVVEHFEEGPQNALTEMRRVLKKDGIAFVSVPFDNPLYRIISRIKNNSILRMLFGKTPIEKTNIHSGKKIIERVFTRAEFRDYLTKAGFEVLEGIPILTKWGLCSAFRVLRGRNFPPKPVYKTLLNPPLNLFGNLLYPLIMKINPWLIGHFQFYVVIRKSADQRGGHSPRL